MYMANRNETIYTINTLGHVPDIVIRNHTKLVCTILQDEKKKSSY